MSKQFDPIHTLTLLIKASPQAYDPVRFKYRNPSNREARKMARALVAAKRKAEHDKANHK